MKRQTEFEKLLAASRFDKARELLQSELAGGKLLDPRSDPYWPKIADRLAARLHAQLGTAAVVDFWETLRDFFVKNIEPEWGHAHKGHIHFRLGIALLPSHLGHGKQILEEAYQEDLVLEKAGKGWPRAQYQSAYVTLAILERLDDSEFANQSDKERFLEQFLKSLDAVIDEAHLKPELVEDALKSIASPAALPSCLSIYGELQETIDRMMPFATVSLAGTLLEALLLAELYYRRGIINLPDGRDMLRVELGPLFKEAVRLSAFPTDSIKVSFQLIHMFRNRVHPGNEVLQTYKLVPRVARTVKVCFELAIIEWGQHFRKLDTARGD